jgi:hypothetical protein
MKSYVVLAKRKALLDMLAKDANEQAGDGEVESLVPAYAPAVGAASDEGPKRGLFASLRARVLRLSDRGR